MEEIGDDVIQKGESVERGVLVTVLGLLHKVMVWCKVSSPDNVLDTEVDLGSDDWIENIFLNLCVK